MIFPLRLARLIGAAAVLSFVSTAVLAAPLAAVVRLQGKVEVVHNGESRAAGLTTELEASDELRTYAGARAELRLSDGSRVTLGENSHYRLDSLNTDDSGRSEGLFSLLAGVFHLATAGPGPRKLDVRTPVATLGVRGTVFWGGYLDPNVVDVVLLEGSELLIDTQGGRTALTAPGQGVTIGDPAQVPAVKTWGQAKLDRAIATVAWPPTP